MEYPAKLSPSHQLSACSQLSAPSPLSPTLNVPLSFFSHISSEPKSETVLSPLSTKLLIA
ncbi:hypothetical protein MBAV_003822 [Candidatus Magnetobacterium bavaricum]|uniref:Uncharacterized protein n=1 Tax=Candidatus Magnetobacterium bavaricum TaxID=29290 RepID=A0A0F3GPT4_9BACT|nr:hypothetical protein MBAV_003822 [Candidatus Magnetobacterium bavaricum]